MGVMLEGRLLDSRLSEQSEDEGESRRNAKKMSPGNWKDNWCHHQMLRMQKLIQTC